MSEQKKGWLARLKAGLSKTTQPLTQTIGSIFTKKKLDQQMLDELEEALICADLGASTAIKIVKKFSKNRFDKDIDVQEVKLVLSDIIAEILEPVAQPLVINSSYKPHVILVIGVNGSGKTTTIAKLAEQYQQQNLSVLLAAGDTFRAAATEQLTIWSERVGVEIVSGKSGGDAAAVAFDAYKQAKDTQKDVLLIDTAGRLHNKSHLMDELKKIGRILKKIDAKAPHSIVLVLDATIGQNAHNQVEFFKEAMNINGLIMTKLDGTAKGGSIISISEKYQLPIHAIGVGEAVDDLQGFSAKDFAKSLMNIN